MRRTTPRVLALAAAGLAAVPAAASAQTNVYSVDAKVASKKLDFGFKVDERDGLQPAAVQTYKVGFEGLSTTGALMVTL